MRKIKPLGVDHPDYNIVLERAEAAINEMNHTRADVLPDCYHLDVLLALATWKKIAEERQEHLDYHNAAWVSEGFDGMVKPKADYERVVKMVEDERKKWRGNG